MGQSLSEPKTEKKTEKFEDMQFSVGSSSMQGWRLEMEDAHSVQLGFAQDPDSAYFAVFDGHGGAKFAELCGSQLSHYLEKDSAFKSGDYSTALSNSFLSIDKAFQEELANELGGTTAIVVLVRDNMIYCANAGDSRAVACVAGRVKELSFDHKPYNQGEQTRIFKAGGWVEFNRVNGNLALSRAVGDFNFKCNPDLPQAEQIVTANPEVIAVDVTPDHEFIVLACDGVWDVMSNIEVVEFVRKKIASNMKPPAICEALLDHCLAPDCRMGGVGCDNMTAVLACFMHRESYGDLVYRCSRDSSVISRVRRLSSLGNITGEWNNKFGSRNRRKSEPPSLMGGSPVIPSKLAGFSDKTGFSNGVTDIPPLTESKLEGEGKEEKEEEGGGEGVQGEEGEEGGGEGEEEVEGDALLIPYETTL